MADDSDDVPADANETFAAGALRIRTEAQKKYAKPVLARQFEIAMGRVKDVAPVEERVSGQLLEQTLGRPYAPALPVNEPQESHAFIEGRGAEFRAKLDRMDATESSGSAAPDEQLRTG